MTQADSCVADANPTRPMVLGAARLPPKGYGVVDSRVSGGALALNSPTMSVFRAPVPSPLKTARLGLVSNLRDFDQDAHAHRRLVPGELVTQAGDVVGVPNEPSNDRDRHSVKGGSGSWPPHSLLEPSRSGAAPLSTFSQPATAFHSLCPSQTPCRAASRSPESPPRSAGCSAAP